LITKYYEPVTNTPKVSLFAEYFLSDSLGSLLAVNTHLINFVELSKFKAQLQEIESILSGHQGAIIFSGDFNTWNRSRWLLLSQMATRLNLTSVSFSPWDTRKIKNFLLSPPLDYIFYRGFNQKPFSAKVIDNISSSDHNPLLVEFGR
jgi:endonuclease/exonuclease/phosphatase (EEP) superfamily protein YafD